MNEPSASSTGSKVRSAAAVMVQPTDAGLPVRAEYWDTACRSLSRRDPVMRRIIRAHPGIALRRRGEPFMTLARAVVGQQISVKAADSVWSKVVIAAPDITPSQVLAAGRDRLLLCGLSGRKAEYILDLADRFNTGAILPDGWSAMDDEAVIKDLVQLRGIGRWTAEMFLIFNLLRPDVLPLDDLGLQKAMRANYFRRAPTMKAMTALAENWRPWRSAATWYLWRSLEPVPVEY